MSIFHFKHFDVKNELSSMKVNTDGVLLGAVAPLCAGDRNILDAGTGTGTIALMIAQRTSEARILGIDIDGPSIIEAGQNFEASPWPGRLEARKTPLQELSTEKKWDVIVSNPPYFDNSLQAPDARRNTARHTEVGNSLSYKDLVVFASKALSEGGRLALILPSDQETALLRYAASFSLFPSKITYIRTTPSKSPSRIIVVLGPNRTEIEKTTLTIQSGGSYTSEYLELMKDFYLFA